VGVQEDVGQPRAPDLGTHPRLRIDRIGLALPVDLRATKAVKLGGRVRAAIFWEAYNLFNTDNFFSYAGRIGSPLFGEPTAAYEKRRQQGGIRIDF